MDGFKQRLIGAVVLVSLAVIFIPMIFEEPHKEKITEELQIPAQPQVPAFTIESPRPPARSLLTEQENQSLKAAETTNPTADSGIYRAEQKTDAGNETSANQSGTSLTQDPSRKRDINSGSDDGAEIDSNMTVITEAADRLQPGQKDQTISANSEAVDSTPLKRRETGAENSWVVQIGTFRNRPGAIKIRDELRESGTPSYTMDIVSGDIPMVRVFAGPTETKEAAAALKQKVDQRYKLQSMIVTYKEQ